MQPVNPARHGKRVFAVFLSVRFIFDKHFPPPPPPAAAVLTTWIRSEQNAAWWGKELLVEEIKRCFVK